MLKLIVVFGTLLIHVPDEEAPRTAHEPHAPFAAINRQV
jgi:hypothetical protein